MPAAPHRHPIFRLPAGSYGDDLKDEYDIDSDQPRYGVWFTYWLINWLFIRQIKLRSVCNYFLHGSPKKIRAENEMTIRRTIAHAELRSSDDPYVFIEVIWRLFFLNKILNLNFINEEIYSWKATMFYKFKSNYNKIQV